MGDLTGAEADLDLADASITRHVYRTTTIWPPSEWFSPQDAAEDERSADEFYAENKAFVREVRTFVRHHDPTKPVVRVPLWPGLEDVVGIMYGPTTAGSGTAWLGPGPTYFDDDAAYDVDGEAAGLAEWALKATGTAADLDALRALLAPSWAVDLIEALTEFCRILGIGLPKN